MPRRLRGMIAVYAVLAVVNCFFQDYLVIGALRPE